MSTRQVSSARSRPASAATPTRKGRYPAYPMSRQNRVTVAAEVPARAASSVIDSSSGASGSSRSSVASLVMASDICGTLAWIRVRTPRGGAAVVVTLPENPSQPRGGLLKSILTTLEPRGVDRSVTMRSSRTPGSGRRAPSNLPAVDPGRPILRDRPTLPGWGGRTAVPVRTSRGSAERRRNLHVQISIPDAARAPTATTVALSGTAVLALSASVLMVPPGSPRPHRRARPTAPVRSRTPRRRPPSRPSRPPGRTPTRSRASGPAPTTGCRRRSTATPPTRSARSTGSTR